MDRRGERNTSATLKALAAAQAECRANDWDRNGRADYWVRDVKTLVEMSGGMLNRTVAAADPTHPEMAAKAGALYAPIPLNAEGRPYDDGTGRCVEGFAICAWHPGYTDMTVVVDENLMQWRKDTAQKPVGRWSRESWAEGWQKHD